MSAKTSKIKAFGIVRVSEAGERTEEELRTVPAQIRGMRGWCKDHGYQLIAEPVAEIDVKGGTPIEDRPPLRAAIEAVESGRAKAVIGNKFDRLFRSVKVQNEFVDRIERAGGEVIALDIGRVTSETAAQWLTAQFLGSVAEYYTRSIRDRTREGQAEAVANGVYIGRGNHFGYDKDERKHLVPNDDAPVAHELFVKRAQRVSWTKLADWLNREHPREDGRVWIHRNVMRIIANPIYKGWIVFGDLVNEEAHAPIVTLAEWEAANGVIGGRAPSNGKPLPLLAGVIRCAGCRYGMRMVRSTRKSGEVVDGYRCPEHHGSGTCPSPAYLRADDIERIVITYFGQWHFETKRHPMSVDRTAVEKAEARVKDLTERLLRVAGNDPRRDALGDDLYNADLKRRRQEIEQAEAELTHARASVEIDNHRPVIKMYEDWDKADIARRHAWLRRAIDSVYVMRNSNRRGTGRLDGDLPERVWIRWAGEDDLERPERGSRKYTIKPVPWPVKLGEPAATVEVPEDVKLPKGATATIGGSRTEMLLANVPQWVKDRGQVDVPSELVQALAKIAESSCI